MLCSCKNLLRSHVRSHANPSDRRQLQIPAATLKRDQSAPITRTPPNTNISTIHSQPWTHISGENTSQRLHVIDSSGLAQHLDCRRILRVTLDLADCCSPLASWIRHLSGSRGRRRPGKPKPILFWIPLGPGFLVVLFQEHQDSQGYISATSEVLAYLSKTTPVVLLRRIDYWNPDLPIPGPII
jgi:hypothetical protein